MCDFLVYFDSSMNISDLARRLKVSPNYLRDTLPKIGFDVGRKAIKLDERVALSIIQQWSTKVRELEEKAVQGKRAAIEEAIQAAPKVVMLPPYVTVRELAQALHLSLPLLMTELMKNGILSSVNERVDFETASIVAEDLGYTVQASGEEGSGAGSETVESTIKTALANAKNLQPRAPVIVVMGHVDHGKTKLLDAIRQTNVVAGESGGITQHIGAYQVEKQGKPITFIDTPGHEAFRAMRSRGAKVADIAVLVVAADDGVKPQTKEALAIIQGANIPFVVAVNKMDKPEANLEKVKQELGALGLVAEDWGGKVIVVPLSAKTGEGIDHLLEVLLLVAEVQQEQIQADPTSHGIGTVIESRIDRGEGPVATIIVQNGTVHQGDVIVHGDAIAGKARLLKNYRQEIVTAAGPAMPVRILGLKVAPEVGDILEVADDQKEYRVAEKRKQQQRSVIDFSTPVVEEKDAPVITTVPVLLKADVLGSLEAILESIAKFEHPEVRIQIIGKGLGNITESDITRAEASHAFVAGFHVNITREAQDIASEKKVEVKNFSVIYDLLDDLKARLQQHLTPELVRTTLGTGTVIAMFREEEAWQIVGVRMDTGLVRAKAKVEVRRHDQSYTIGLVERLQAGKETIHEAAEGTECGMQIACEKKVTLGDKLTFIAEEERARFI